MLGCRSSAVKWFKSYIENRQQITCIDQYTSDPCPVLCGVPQGSILSPMIFCCYINDLSQHLEKSKSFIYADDTALLFSDNDIEHLSSNMSLELQLVDRWFGANRLCVNISKTNSILIRNPRKYRDNNKLLIMLENKEVVQVDHCKYLGIIIDECLTWEKHIDRVISKVRQRTGLLWRILWRANTAKNRKVTCWQGST